MIVTCNFTICYNLHDMSEFINRQSSPGVTEAPKNWVRNLLLRLISKVPKTIIFFTGGPDIGCANALGSVAPRHTND